MAAMLDQALWSTESFCSRRWFHLAQPPVFCCGLGSGITCFKMFSQHSSWFSSGFVQARSPSTYVPCSRDPEHYLCFGDIFWIRLPLERLINTSQLLAFFVLVSDLFWEEKLTAALFQWLAPCLKFSNGFETPKWKMKIDLIKSKQKLPTWSFIHRCNRNFCLALG